MQAIVKSFKLVVGTLVDRAEEQFKDPKSGPQRKKFVLDTLEGILKNAGLEGFVLKLVMKLAEIALEWALSDLKSEKELGN